MSQLVCYKRYLQSLNHFCFGVTKYVILPVDECLHSHSLCQSQSGRRKSLPTRVLDVGRAGSSGNPYLILTEGITGTWSALSYCWGGNSSFVLRTDNIDKFRSGFYQIEDYPKTFRDAIMITRSLHISFIWIDALCILQDYSEDWAVEAGRMQDVYAGAIITLCASNSTRSSEGMLGARQTPADICPIPWGTERSTGEVTVFLRSGSHFWDANMRGEPLNRRGWTLQESLLSPRELSYGKQQTAWECQQIRTSESGRPILPGERFRKKDMIQTLITGKRDYRQRITQSLTRLSLRIMPVKFSLVPLAWEQHHDAMYTRWFAVTQEFTSRSLTYPSDTFPALSGLAKVFQSFLNDQYCAGLWKNDMVRGLMWARPSARGTSTQTPRPALDYRIPSWSWASISGGPIYNAITNEEKWSTRYITELARVVSVVIKPRFSDPYGQISDGFLTLSAPFRPLSDQTFDKNNDQNTSLPALEQRIRQNSALPTAEFGQQHVPHTGQRFAVLRIAKFHEKFTSEITGRMALNRTAGLLILETTGQQENEYRRIGLLILNSSQLDDSYDPIETNLLSFDVMSEAKFVKKEVKIV